MTFCRPLSTTARFAVILLAATLLQAMPFALAATQKPIFPLLQYEPYPVASPVAMTEGDMNGDGTPDSLYATTSGGTTTLTPALRSGSTVTLGTTTAVASCTATSVLLADLNKDSKLDAVVGCSENTTAILTGKGDGTFTVATTLTGSGRHYQATDLNNDGLPELIYSIDMSNGVTVSPDAEIQIAINKTSSTGISFGAPTARAGYFTIYPVNNNYSASNQFLLADVNQDGKLDLLTGAADHSIANYVPHVLYGNGDGTFGPLTNLANSFGTLATADFDHDGALDIANYYVTTGGTVLSISFPNSGKTSIVTTVHTGVVSIHPLDLNGDGKLDILLAGALSTPLIGDGTGSFTVGKSYVTPGSFYAARAGTKGVDIFYTTPAGYFALHNDGTGAFDGIAATYFSDSPIVTDLNSDGLSDLVAAQVAGSLSSQKGNGDGTFSALSSSITIPYGSLPVSGDFNGDGILDVALVAAAGSTTIYIPNGTAFGASLTSFKGNGDGTFASLGLQGYIGTSTSQDYINPQGVATGDFNGDSKLDIALSYNDPDQLRASGLGFIPGKGDGTFPQDSTAYYSAVVNIDIQPAGIVSRPFAADLNADGKLDLVWGHNAYINQGSNSFTPLALPSSGTPLLLADLNGDGKTDILMNNAIYAGRGDGSFVSTPIATITMPGGVYFITANSADLDGDGNLDLIIQSYNRMAFTTVAYGDGKGNFTTDPNIYTTGTERPFTASLARLNKSARTGTGPDYIVFASGAAMPLLNALGTSVSSTITLTPQLTSVKTTVPAYFNATVNGSYPTGTITLSADDGTVLGTATIKQGTMPQQVMTVTFNPTFTQPGTYKLIATYSGDTNNTPASSSPLTINVTRQFTAINFSVLSVNGNTYQGRKVTLHTSVTGFNPTGQVTFASGTTTLGTVTLANGAADLDYTFNATGNTTITVSYSGDIANAPASSDFSLPVVSAPDFSFTTTAVNATVRKGDNAQWMISLGPINGYSGIVTVTCQTISCGTTTIDATGRAPAQTVLSIPTASFVAAAQSSGTSYGPIYAALLLFLAAGKRRWRYSMQMHLCLIALAALLGLSSISGCSSGTSSSNGSTSTPTPTSKAYTVGIVLSDANIGVSHTANLTINVSN